MNAHAMLKRFLPVLLILATGAAGHAQTCTELFGGQPRAQLSIGHPRTKAEFDRAFQNGLVPDLNQKDQRKAFAGYLERTTSLSPIRDAHYIKTELKEVAEIQRTHPELEKKPFASVEVSYFQMRKPSVPVLEGLREKLFAVDAEIWKFIEGTEDQQLGPYWNDVFKSPEQARKIFRAVADPGPISYSYASEETRRLRRLFIALHSRYAKAEGRSKDAIARTLMDIAFISSLRENFGINREGLESSDGDVQNKALRKILESRNEFLTGLKNANFKLDVPKDVASLIRLTGDRGSSFAQNEESWIQLRSRVSAYLEKHAVPDSVATHLTIRQLSFAESPFRSLVGGPDPDADCSSWTYFKTAMENRYNYFTITDDEGKSQGHVTVILGRATNTQGVSEPVAFIDKLQWVSRTNIPWFLEGVRRSLARGGYKLAIPIDLGSPGSHTITNYPSVHETLRALHSYVEQTQIFTDFIPEPTTIAFDHTHHSRVDMRLPVKPLLPYEPKGMVMMVRPVTPFWRLDAP